MSSTQITVESILEKLAAGESKEQILVEHQRYVEREMPHHGEALFGSRGLEVCTLIMLMRDQHSNNVCSSVHETD